MKPYVFQAAAQGALSVAGTTVHGREMRVTRLKVCGQQSVRHSKLSFANRCLNT